MRVSRVRKRNVLVRWLEPSRKSEAGIEFLGSQNEYNPVRVLVKGDDCTGDFEVGDTLWCLGYKSGIEVEKDIYLVDESICHAKVEKE